MDKGLSKWNLRLNCRTNSHLNSTSLNSIPYFIIYSEDVFKIMGHYGTLWDIILLYIIYKWIPLMKIVQVV